MKVDGIQSATIFSRYRPRSLGSLAVSEAETGGKAMLSERWDFDYFFSSIFIILGGQQIDEGSTTLKALTDAWWGVVAVTLAVDTLGVAILEEDTLVTTWASTWPST